MRSRPTSIAGRFIERDVEDVDKEEADLPLSIFLMTFFTDLGDLVEVEVLELKDMRFMLVTTFMTMARRRGLGSAGRLGGLRMYTHLARRWWTALAPILLPFGCLKQQIVGSILFSLGCLGAQVHSTHVNAHSPSKFGTGRFTKHQCRCPRWTGRRGRWQWWRRGHR